MSDPVTPEQAQAAVEAITFPTVVEHLKHIADNGPKEVTPHDARAMLSYVGNARSKVNLMRATLHDLKVRHERLVAETKKTAEAWDERERVLIHQVTSAQRRALLAEGELRAATATVKGEAVRARKAIALLVSLDSAYERAIDAEAWEKLFAEVSAFLDGRTETPSKVR